MRRKSKAFVNKCFEIDNEWQKAGTCITSTANLAKVTIDLKCENSMLK